MIEKMEVLTDNYDEAKNLPTFDLGLELLRWKLNEIIDWINEYEQGRRDRVARKIKKQRRHYIKDDTVLKSNFTDAYKQLINTDEGYFHTIDKPTTDRPLPRGEKERE